MLSASASSSRRGRSAALEPGTAVLLTGLSDKFKDRKPAKRAAKAKAAKPKTRKYKLLKSKNLHVECFIDDAWHPATIKCALEEGGEFFLEGYEYTVVYDEDGYQEKRVYDHHMRFAA